MQMRKKTMAIAWLYTGIWLLEKLKMAACVLVAFSLFASGFACEMKGILAEFSWFCCM